MFLKELVADQIRRFKIMSSDVRPPPVDGSVPAYDGSADNELQAGDVFSSPDGKVEQLETEPQQVAELTVEMTTEKKHINDGSRHDLGQRLWHSLGRFTSRRAPLAPRLCMLCGGAEFSERSSVCSKCGTSLRP